MKRHILTLAIAAVVCLGQMTALAAERESNAEMFEAATRLNTIGMLSGIGNLPDGTWAHPFTDVPMWADKWVGYAYQTSQTGMSAHSSPIITVLSTSTAY